MSATFCNDLSTTLFVSARFGNDGSAGSSGDAISAGDEASPVKSLKKVAELVTLTPSKNNIVLYPADDFNDLVNDCGATFSRSAHLLGFNSTRQVDGTVASGTRIVCPMASVSQEYSRAIIVTGGTLTISDIEFIGAGVRVTGDGNEIILRSVTFSQMSSVVSSGGDGYGSAVDASSGALVQMFQGSVVESLGVYGGAMSIRGASELRLCGVVYFGNDASLGGGAIYLDSSTLTILSNDADDTSCLMTLLSANTAPYGGGLYATGTSTVTGNSLLNITSNIATKGGGGMAVSSTMSTETTALVDFNVHSNSAHEVNGQGGITFYPGGGVHVSGPGSVEIKSVQIEANVGGSGGGVYVLDAQTMSIDSHSTIHSNNANGNGGGVRVENSTLLLSGSRVSENHAIGGSGGGLSVESGTLHVTEANLIMNVADTNGGAIHSSPSNQDSEIAEENSNKGTGFNTWYSEVHVVGTKFQGSVVGDAGKGGHVTLVHTNASFGGCLFEMTISENGGAIHCTTTKMLVHDKTKVHNTEARRDGGGVYATKHSIVTMDDIELLNTKSGEDGGALYVDESSKVNVTQSSIIKAIALGNGGALAISGSSIGVIMDTSISATTAGTNGGAVHVSTLLTGASGSMNSLSYLEMHRVQTTNTKALLNGGTIYVENGHMKMNSCVDVGASAMHGSGGSIFVKGLGSHTMQATSFQHGAAKYGGFLSSMQTKIHMKEIFVNNATAYKDYHAPSSLITGGIGGALHLIKTEMTHDACTFTKITSQISGGVWMESSTLQWPTTNVDTLGLRVSTFSECTAPTGPFVTAYGKNTQVPNRLGRVDARRCSSLGDTLATPTTTAETSIIAATLYIADKVTLHAQYVRIMDTSAGASVYVGERAFLDLSFSSLETTSSGTGLRAYHFAQVRISDTDIKKNNQSGITALPGSSVNITRTQFQENVPGEYGGGAVYSQKSSVRVTDSTFFRNIGQGKLGGAVLCTDKSTCVFDTCEFSNPSNPVDPKLSLSTKGSAVTIDRSYGVVRSCNFHDLAATTGGALSVSMFGTVDISDTLFQRCTGSEGAALYMEDSTVTVKSSTFSQNKAQYDGGAMRVSTSSLSLNDTTVENNEAGSSGGAISLSLDTTMTMKKSTVRKNRAWMGGGISMGRNSNADFEDNTFYNNFARAGGAIHVSQNQFNTTFTRCHLEGNMARFGAAMFLEFSTIIFKDGTCSKNVATLYGAIRLAGDATIEVVNSYMVSNRGQVGAALYANDDTTVNVRDSTLSGNIALEDAGAIYVDDATQLMITRTKVLQNRALRGHGGGIVRRGGARANVQASTFTSNTAGQRGGAIDQDRLMCGDSAACAVLYDDVMNIEQYTKCLSGRRPNDDHKIDETTLLPSPAHVTCTHIHDTSFENNHAQAGAGVFWRNAYEYDVSLQLPHLPSLATNIFRSNRLTTCDDEDTFLDRFSCESNIGSDTANVGIGWTPSTDGYVPGIPMQNVLFLDSKYHKATSAHVFLTALDYYGSVYRLDQTTSCTVQRQCEDSTSIYDRQSGKCKASTSTEKGTSAVATSTLSNEQKDSVMDAYPMHLTGNEALSVNGRVLFSDFIVRATPQPNNTYSVSFDCRVFANDEENEQLMNISASLGSPSSSSGGTVVLQPNIVDVLRIINCGGGTQLTSALSCQTCIPGRYSHDGKGCTECPTGGNCAVSIQMGGSTQVVTVGEDQPQLYDGFWIGEAPPSWTMQECNPEIVNTWRDNICPPGSKLANANQNSTCIDTGWDKDRIHRCRTGRHMYECLTKVACSNRSTQIVAYIVPEGKAAGDAVTVTISSDSATNSETSSETNKRRLNNRNQTQQFIVPPGKVAGDYVEQEYGNTSKICRQGYQGPKCGVCERNYTKDGANVCHKCAGGDIYASQAIYGSTIAFFLFAAVVLILMYLRDGGFQLYRKGLWLQRKILRVCCCKCCDNFCCKLCRRLSNDEHAHQAKLKLTRASLIHTKSFFGKRKTADFESLNQALDDHTAEDTVWFRPEKFKIILSFLQVFQEYRRTYRIKWPQVVQDYMDFFSSLVDFDIFRLVSVDCIAPITHLNKVVGFVLLPIVALIVLFLLFHLGRVARMQLLKKHLRHVDGKNTGTAPYPPRTQKQEEEVSRREKMRRAEEERKRKLREEQHVKMTKREKCDLCCTNLIYRVVTCLRQSMHLEHAQIGAKHEDSTLPHSIGEIKNNINAWKARVAIQIQMGFFLVSSIYHLSFFFFVLNTGFTHKWIYVSLLLSSFVFTN